MPFIVAVIVSTLVYLESWPVGQFLLGRPALLLPLLGLATGNPWAGLWLGAVLELLTLRTLPMGATLPPDPALAGVWTLLGLGAGARPELALLIAVPLCWLAPWLSEAQRRINGVLWRPRFLQAAEEVDAARCNRLMGAVLAQTALLGAAVSALMLAAVALAAGSLDPLAARLAEGRLAQVLPLPWAVLAVALGGLWRHAGGRLGRRTLWAGAALGLMLAALWISGRLP
jgi:mannose/fructose/N-acetylgalactosamine-specific phosphotransferase system component IIC